MGQGNLPAGGKELGALLLALTLLVPALPGQGPLYRERWGFLHLSRLRGQVLHELAGRDLATRQQVAALLLADDEGIPFRGPAKALAMLRSVDCDDAFMFRCMTSAYVLPEVVDPAADNEACRELNASVFLPYVQPAPGGVTFSIQVLGAGSTPVFTTEITEGTAVEDLRMARARAVVPCAELADGQYELLVSTRFDGKGPRPGDYVLRHTFAVLRGYQQRAETAMTQAKVAAPRLPELPAALLTGLSAEVVRAYTGEAFAVTSTAVDDLRRLEAALQNVAAERPPLQGLTGRLTAALPAGTQRTLQVTLDLPADRTEKPLLLVAPAGPAYDVRVRRPGAPRTTSPRLLAEACRGFDAGGRYHVVWLESTGGGIDYAAAVQQALELLPQVLPITPGKVVLVAEREAAVAVGLQLPQLAPRLRGLAMVSGGLISRQALESMHGLQLLACPAQDDPSSAGLLRARELVAGDYGEVKLDGGFTFDAAAGRAWLFGVPQSKAAILQLCERAFAAQ